MADPFRLQLFCNFQGPRRAHGWSEVYWLRTGDPAAAQAWGFDLCNRRRLWYGDLVTTVYAQVSQGEHPLDTWAVPVDAINSFPVNLPRPQPPNDPWVGLYYGSGTATGRWGNRTWKGVPDDWIHGTRCSRPGGPPRRLGPGPLPPLALGPAAAGGQRPLLLGPGQTLELLQASLPDALCAYTGFLTGGAGGPTVEALDDCRFGAVSKRDPRSDQGWRRVSCEGGVCCVGGFWVGPRFSFCGQVVGAVRACYRAPCRWYAGGPVSAIRFYDVPPANPCYFGRLRFGPKAGSGYWNTALAGELTSVPAGLYRKFYDGLDVSQGSRDGAHADVTPEEAAGQAPWLWPGVFAA